MDDPTDPTDSAPTGIAIIGMAGRFPGAADIESFWANLVAGVESTSFFTPEEVAAVGVDPELLADPSFVRARAVIDGAELFDAAFFDISPREAEVIDPQQRLMLEHAWAALENAGHDPRRFPGSIGMFAGAGVNTYLLSNLQKNPEVMGAVGAFQAMLGSGADFLATRVSFKLGLRGPSLTVQTACSTSLVAVHLAVQSLLAGECDMALAGGVRLLVPRKGGHLYQPGNIFSQDGHCRPFDAAATGTTDGEGVGLVVLRRLDDALAAGDHVHAVILGSAINNDGDSKMAYTVPSVEGQAEVIATAQALAGVDPGSLGMLEAHGTGTPLGDPIEVAALSRVFAATSIIEEPGGPCALGSLKSNMGHLDAAAGIAALIKTALAVERGTIPPSLHFERPNPQIDFAATPFYVPVEATPWRQEGPRRAGVSSFGIGGTNAHVVLEQAPAVTTPEMEEPEAVPEGRPRLLVLSARTPAALEEMTKNLAGHLASHPDLALGDVARTLQRGRAELDQRRAVVAASLADAAEVLSTLDPKRVLSRSRPPGERAVFFLFPGQGAQHPGMGEALYRHEPVFREELERAAEILRPRLGLDLLEVLYPPAPPTPPAREQAEAAARLRQTALAQPALFAVEYALARLWMSWGVRPAAMLGHSVGEYVAACLAGVFSLEDALALVAERGRLMQEMPGGAMLAVALSEEELAPDLGGLALAAVNGPRASVVSGTVEEVEALSSLLTGRGVEVRALHTSHAFHSAAMDPMLARFAAAFEGVPLHPPRIPFVSNLTGTWIDAKAATSPDYWVRHLRETVRFSAGLEALFARPGGVYLEVGPGRSLSSLARQHPRHPGASPILTSLPAAGDDREGAGRDAEAALLRALGQAWLAGVEIDWTGVDAGKRRVPLPNYPFERVRYWVEPAAGGEPRRRALPAGERSVADWFWVPLWRQALPLRAAEKGEAGRWLLLTNSGGQGGLSERLAARLRERGEEVVEARAGSRFEESGGDFTVRPGQAADYGALLERLAARGFVPNRIVHLWNVGRPEEGGIEGARHEMERGFWSLVHLARALGDRRPPENRPPLHLGIVASGVERITGAEELAPARATLLGPATHLPQEYPGITASVIDVDLPATGSRREAGLVDRLLAELEAAEAEPRVAYRGGERWLQVYEPLPLKGGGPPPLPSRERGTEGVRALRLPLREGAVCLITGGLGGVGLELATLLAREAKAKLVLTGRTPFPAREEWPALGRGTGRAGRVARVARRLLEIEALGGEVLTLAADVTDAAAMRAALAEARRRFGRIEGVIHAAGLPGGGLMQWRPLAEMAAVLAPKVEGTLLLAEALALHAEDAPDFLVLTSSLNALAGGPGQVDYTAANAFLDAFARSQAGELPVRSINWDAWHETGMAADGGEAEEGAPEVLGLEPFPHLLLGARGVAGDGAAVFVGRLHPRASWVLDEHRLGGQPVLPGTAYLEMARAAFAGLASAATGGAGAEAGAIEIRGVQFLTPLRVADGEARDCHVVLHANGHGLHRFSVQSGEGGEWVEHVTGEVGNPGAAAAAAEEGGSALDLSFAGWDEVVVGEAYLEDLRQAGMGPRWEVLKKVYRRPGETVALLELAPQFAGETEALGLHPALLDVATGFAQEYVPRSPGYYLPLSYKRLHLAGPLPARVYSHARLHDAASAARETLNFDITLFDAAGVPRVRIDEYTIKRVDVAAALRGHPRREGRGAAALLPEGAQGMPPEQAAEAFRRLLAGPALPQVAVSVRPLPELLAHARSVTVEGLAGQGRPDATAGGHSRPDLETPYVAPRGELEERLAAIWADVLGLDRVGVADDFFELGGHSLLGIQMISRIRDALGVEVPLGQLFEVSNVADFAVLVAAELAESERAPQEEIPRVPRDGELPLSYTQERLWFLEQLEPGSAFYSIPGATRMVGTLDVPALAAALTELVGRHESLRTTFGNRDGRPLQVVAPPPAAVPLPRIDLTALPHARREEELWHRVTEAIRRPLDLVRGPLLRAALLALDSRDQVFLYSLHHIVSDGWSGKVFYYELATLYGAFAAGRPSPLPPVPLQYVDYAAWQRRTLTPEVLVEQLAWWRERLAGCPALELPLDRPRPAVERFRGKNRLVLVPPGPVRGLLELSRGAGATLFMGLLAVLETLLLRLTGQSDFAVGSPIANRGRRQLDSVIGFFANTLVLRTDLSGNPGFLDLLGRVREVTLGAYAHEQLPFERLVEEVQPGRDMSRNPLFQVMCVLQNQPSEEVPAGDLEILPVLLDPGTSKFDFMIMWTEEAAGLSGLVEHNLDLFDDTTIDRFYRHHEALLAAVLADPARPLLDLPMLGEAERHQLLAEWNDTARAAAAARPVHERVGEQARRQADAVAAVFEGEHLTYGDLDAGANRLAHALSRRGVGPESPVGICAGRSLAMVEAALAVLKAGGALVALDPAYPHERLAAIADDAGLAALLCDEALLGHFPGHREIAFVLDGSRARLAGESAADPGAVVDPEHPMYAIYTSGSTGRPKGIVVPHRAFASFLDWQLAASGGAPVRTVQFAAFGFCVSFQEIFSAWCSGGTVVVAGEMTRRDLGALGGFLAGHGIERLHLPYAALKQLAESAAGVAGAGPACLREVITAGEALRVTPAIRALFSGLPGCTLSNQYGASETHVVTALTLSGSPADWPDLPAVGRAITGVTVHLLDGRHEPAPLGVRGEIFAGGAAVPRCYLNDPALTAWKVVPDPFSSEPGARLYRTGDLGRRLAGGLVESLGRIDGQVKVRGFRVELGEVETVLAREPGVRDAAVVPVGQGEGLKLVAYVVPAAGVPEGELVEGLRRALKRQVPEHMVPAAFVLLPALPVNANGKLDHEALPAPGESRAAAAYRPPRTPVEEALAAIWQEVLGIGRVGLDDPFFELGGHSLLATQVVSRARGAFGVEVPLRLLFEAPTLAGLAERVEALCLEKGALPATPVAPAPRGGRLPLSFAQERLWFLDRLAPGAAVYNMPLALHLDGDLDLPALAGALGEIVRRHEVLRTTFALPEGGSEPVQVVGAPPAVLLPLIDLAGLGERAEGEARRRAAEDARLPFDLARGPLFRPLLFRLDGRRSLFSGTLHHTVADGWSLGILVREVVALYPVLLAGAPSPLPPLAVQYADYALWQRRWLSGPVLAGEVAWWREHLAGLPASLPLPTDRPRPAVQSLRGAHLPVSLPATLTAALSTLARENGATLFMALLGAFAAVLARASGATDLALGTPIAGRNRMETEGLIGLFVNSLVLRADLSEDPSFLEILARTRAATLAAYAHQDVPFERLVAELAPDRNLSWSPLFQVMFVLQNAPLPPLDLPGLTLADVEVVSGTTKFDLALSLTESAAGLAGVFEYASDLFDATTVARLREGFASFLEAALGAPGAPLSALALPAGAAGAARQQLLVEWNDTAAPAGGRCLHEQFEERTERTPNAPAVIASAGTLSYADLDRLAEALAGRLRRLGRLPSAAESRVGVAASPSGLRIAALLAVHKAGGAYVPLDPELPPARLTLLAADAGLAAVIVEGSSRDRLAEAVPGLPLVELDDLELAGEPLPAGPRRAADPDTLAYVVYTSGSAGIPNGVQVSHRAVANLIATARRQLGVTPAARVLHQSSLSFDAAALEIFVALTSGAALVVGSLEETLPGLRLAEFLRRHEVSVAVTTPAVLALLPEADLPALRTVTVGGESCPADLAGRWAARGTLVNCYGPTETTVYSTSWPCEAGAGRVPPIGRPVANTQAYVLDPRLEPVPAGAPGELCLGGAGLARGYLGRPELTAGRFVPHPFASASGNRLYRTGDLARFLPDGALEFLGRVDAQVKVRGLRIEPGEVEAALTGHPRVREALVAAVEERGGGSRLVAFLVLTEAAPGREGEEAAFALELRERLAGRLPAYMVPTQLVPLDALPLTPHGKVDRRALLRLAPSAGEGWGAAAEYVAPQTPLEEMLAEIWIDLLGLERVGAHDSFFSLGGHSLQGIRLMSRIADEFGVELPVKALFEAPTLAALAERIGEEMTRLLGDEEEQLLAVGEAGLG